MVDKAGMESEELGEQERGSKALSLDNSILKERWRRGREEESGG